MNTHDDQGGSPPAWDSSDPNASAQMPGQPQGYAGGPALPTAGSSIASLICGILSIPCCMAWGVPGLLLGIAAIILSRRANASVQQGTAGGSTKGLALAGLICGIVGVVLGLLYLVLLVIGIAAGGLNNQPGFGP